MRPRRRPLAILASTALALAAGVVCGIGWWVDGADSPEKSDVIVVLAGDFARPLYAADLYLRGYAPEIWLSRPAPLPAEKYLTPLDIHLVPEERINREILIRKGVPAGSIHLYGQAVQSTVHEVMVFQELAPLDGKKILVVTSRYHARRARLIFKHFFPKSDVRVAATPYSYFSRRWWKNQDLARNSILEIFKTLFYLAGGRFVSGPT